MNFLDGLNNKQLDAVKNNNQNLLIIAGAGTGKTKTLVSKVCFQIQEKIYLPYQILAMTFSNNAAKEMKKRLAANLTYEQINQLTVSTFHSFCVRILRMFGDKTNIGKNFTIYDASESDSVLKEILKQRDSDISIGQISSYVDKIKNDGHYIKTFVPTDEFTHEYYEIYLQYEKTLVHNGAVDFGGLITKTIELLINNSDVKTYYNSKFKYIMVDEFQDTNTAQYKLLKLLKGEECILCAIGDDDQVLFQFRGANIDNILNFDKENNATVIKLEENYRSHKNILDVANDVISKNIFRKGKSLWTSTTSHNKISLMEFSQSDEEARFVIHDIKEKIKRGENPEEIVVLYRNNYQSRALEDHCTRNQIPYKVVGGLKFFDRKEIKDILAFFKMFINKKDKLAFLRTIDMLTEKIGTKTQQKILAYMASYESFIEGLDILVKNNEIKLPKAVILQLSNYVYKHNLIERSFSSHGVVMAFDLILYHTNYINKIKALKKEDQYRIDNIMEFRGNLEDIQKQSNDQDSVVSYIDQISLERSKDAEHGDSEKRISLMTIHASKGLEFDHVYIVGVEEGVFPSHQINGATQEEKEGERRLFYVAITRGKKDVKILYSRYRMVYGKSGYMMPSRFIKDVALHKVHFIKNLDF